MQNKVNLLFPIEIMNRELDFRLFLAAYCARPNNRIFIGQTDAIYRVISTPRVGCTSARTSGRRAVAGREP
jgi:hypothetical protein